MKFPNIVHPYHSRQHPWTFHNKMIIKHFNLYVCPFDTIVTVRNRVNNKLCPAKLRIFGHSLKNRAFSQLGIFFYLCFHKSKCFISLLQNASAKFHILYNIHPVTYFCRPTFVTNKSHSCPRKETLRVYTKQKYCCSRYSIFAIYCKDKIMIVSQIKLGIAFGVANFFNIIIYEAPIYICQCCTSHRLILKIPYPFGIYQLKSLLKVQSLAFVTYA